MGQWVKQVWRPELGSIIQPCKSGVGIAACLESQHLGGRERESPKKAGWPDELQQWASESMYKAESDQKRAWMSASAPYRRVLVLVYHIYTCAPTHGNTSIYSNTHKNRNHHFTNSSVYLKLKAIASSRHNVVSAYWMPYKYAFIN